jgi:hypothetical protein
VQVGEARRLLAEDVFLDVAVEERVGHVKLVRRPVLRGDEGEDGADRCGFYDGRKV